jgi:transcriptional regulator with XRE-family HTH domain
MLTAEQARAARALIKQDQPSVAEGAGVSVPTLKRWENGVGPLTGAADRVSALQLYYERLGVIFIPENGEGPGVRLKKTSL